MLVAAKNQPSKASGSSGSAATSSATKGQNTQRGQHDRWRDWKHKKQWNGRQRPQWDRQNKKTAAASESQAKAE